MEDGVTKVCSKCGKEKDLADFSPDKRALDGREGRCKKCMSARWADYNKRKAAENPKWMRHREWRLEYGLSPEQVETMYIQQHGLCLICGKSMTLDEAHVDHDHQTDRVRALLCGLCNPMIGMARENCETLSNAIQYLNSFKGTSNG